MTRVCVLHAVIQHFNLLKSSAYSLSIIDGVLFVTSHLKKHISFAFHEALACWFLFSNKIIHQDFNAYEGRDDYRSWNGKEAKDTEGEERMSVSHLSIGTGNVSIGERELWQSHTVNSSKDGSTLCVNSHWNMLIHTQVYKMYLHYHWFSV